MNRFTRHFKRSKSENITKIIFFVFFILMCLVFISPIVYCLISTFKTNVEITKTSGAGVIGPFQFPSTLHFEAWANIFTDFKHDATGTNFLGMLWNSAWFTVAKVVLSMAASTVLAYCCAKFRFPGKTLIYATVIFVQTIPIFGSGSTSFKIFSALNMVNNPALFWVAWITGFDMSFIIMYGTFKGVSNSYSESASIDGASEFSIFFKVILPMVFPSILAIMVTNSLTVWNEFSTMQIYLNNYPNLAYGLYLYQNASSGKYSYASYYAAMILSMLPILIIYALSQKLVLKNISVGGLKG